MPSTTLRAFFERRAFPRWPVVLDGLCYGRTGSSKCLITEISEGGLAMVTGQKVTIGEVLTIEWHLGEDREYLQVSGIIRDITPQFVGLQFLNITLADRLRIGEFIVNRATGPAEARQTM